MLSATDADTLFIAVTSDIINSGRLLIPMLESQYSTGKVKYPNISVLNNQLIFPK